MTGRERCRAGLGWVSQWEGEARADPTRAFGPGESDERVGAGGWVRMGYAVWRTLWWRHVNTGLLFHHARTDSYRLAGQKWMRGGGVGGLFWRSVTYSSRYLTPGLARPGHFPLPQGPRRAHPASPGHTTAPLVRLCRCRVLRVACASAMLQESFHVGFRVVGLRMRRWVAAGRKLTSTRMGTTRNAWMLNLRPGYLPLFIFSWPYASRQARATASLAALFRSRLFS